MVWTGDWPVEVFCFVLVLWGIQCYGAIFVVLNCRNFPFLSSVKSRDRFCRCWWKEKISAKGKMTGKMTARLHVTNIAREWKIWVYLVFFIIFLPSELALWMLDLDNARSSPIPIPMQVLGSGLHFKLMHLPSCVYVAGGHWELQERLGTGTT